MKVAIATPPGMPTKYRKLTKQEEADYKKRQEEYEKGKLSRLRDEKVRDLKEECARKIVRQRPIHKQVNELRRIMGLIVDNNLVTAKEALDKENSCIDGLRKKSKKIEKKIGSIDYEELISMEFSDHPVWKDKE
jgi:hypothetical protein